MQRAPLTRIGQVHIYNNYYDTTKLNGYAHSYSVNSRAGARSCREQLLEPLRRTARSRKLLSGDGTGAVAGSGNLVNGTATDLAAAYNAGRPRSSSRPPSTGHRP